MPFEGQTEMTTQAAGATTQTQTTSDGTAKTTDAGQQPGAGTQTAQPTEAQTTINVTGTPEFKAALTAAIEKKIPQIRKQLARSLTGEKEPGNADPNDLQQQLSEYKDKLRSFEAKASVRDYLTDPKNKLNVPAGSMSGVEELVLSRLEFGDDGKPSNLKEAIESVKTAFPPLFAAPTSSINANNGRRSEPVGKDMNAIIRHAAGYRSN